MTTSPAVDAAILAVEAQAAVIQPQENQLINLLQSYNNAREALKKHLKKRQVNALALLQPSTQRLVCTAEATVGRTRSIISELAQSRWQLHVDAFADAFDYQSLTSQDFLSELRALLRATTCDWDQAHAAISAARNARTSGTKARSGVSSTRAWIRQDLKDAATALGLEQPVSPEKGKKRKVCRFYTMPPIVLRADDEL